MFTGTWLQNLRKSEVLTETFREVCCILLRNTPRTYAVGLAAAAQTQEKPKENQGFDRDLAPKPKEKQGVHRDLAPKLKEK